MKRKKYLPEITLHLENFRQNKINQTKLSWEKNPMQVGNISIVYF